MARIVGPPAWLTVGLRATVTTPLPTSSPPPPAPRPSMTTFYCTMTAWLVPKPQPFVLWFVEPLNYMDYFSPCLATVPSLHSIQYKLFKNLN